MAIFVWSYLVILPVLRFDDVDDAFFLEVARLWTEGLPPFVASFDAKGLAFYALLALVESVAGASLTTLKLVGATAAALGALALYRIAARYDRPAAVLCATLYPVFVIVAGDACYQTMSALVLFAFLAALAEPAGRREALLSGLCVGLACCVKQTCALDALALVCLLVAGRRETGTAIAALASFFIGAALAPLGFLAFYALRGDVGPLIQDFVVAALLRPTGLSLYPAFGRFILWLTPFWVVAAVCLRALWDRRTLAGRAPMFALWLWLAVELAAIALQRAGYYTHMVPLLAPMLLVASLYFSAYGRRRGRGAQIGGLVFLGCVGFLGAMGGHGLTILERMRLVDYEELRQTAETLAATGPSAQDRLFVLNGPVWPNLLTRIRPATPYYYWLHFMCPFPGAGLDALEANFDARPRYIVFENPARRLDCESDAFDEKIRAHIAADYKLLSVSHGARSTAEVYERMP